MQFLGLVSVGLIAVASSFAVTGVSFARSAPQNVFLSEDYLPMACMILGQQAQQDADEFIAQNHLTRAWNPVSDRCESGSKVAEGISYSFSLTRYIQVEQGTVECLAFLNSGQSTDYGIKVNISVTGICNLREIPIQ